MNKGTLRTMKKKHSTVEGGLQKDERDLRNRFLFLRNFDF